jgi:hypothetical protein
MRDRPARRTCRLAVALLLAAAAAQAAPAPSRKVGFIGGMAKPADPQLGTQISTALEKRLLRARVPGFEFLPDGVARGRAKLKGGPINPKRMAEAGRAIGADKVLVCLITYERVRAAVEPGTSKTTTVSRDVTQYVEEVYYVEVPNPDYEEPITAAIPLGNIGPVSVSAIVGGTKVPKTIKEKRVTKKVTHEVEEPGEPPAEKPGHVLLRAGYVLLDAASGKLEKRDTVSYRNEIEAIFDAMESDEDLRRKAAESTVESLERSVVAKLGS